MPATQELDPLSSTEAEDVISFSNLLHDSLHDDQSLGLYPPPLDIPQLPMNDYQDLTDVGALFQSFFDFFDPSHTTQPSLDWEVDNGLFPDSFLAPAQDNEKAKCIAQLEELKKQKDHIQECIQLLCVDFSVLGITSNKIFQ